jgi:signal transduction histidine kinase
MARVDGSAPSAVTAGGADSAAARLFAGPGEVRALCRALDWAETPLGPVAGWPQSLRTAVSVCLASGFPKLVMWGPELVQLYNDAFRAVLQAKHPAGLGQRARDCWPELWDVIGPMYRSVLETGASIFLEDQLFTPERRGEVGLVEEAYFTFSYSAIPDEAYRPAGILATVFETTRHVQSRGERERTLERVNAELRAIVAERERLLAESETARADAEQARAVAERAAAALAGSEARFRTVQDASPMGFAIHRPVREGGRPDGAVIDFTLPYVNEAGARIVGHPRARLLAGTVLGIWPGTGPEGVFADYVRVLETGEPFYREILYEHDGLAAGLTLTVVRIGAGAGAEIGVTFTDVTARLRAERERDRLFAELGAERERLRAVILHMPSPLALHVGPEHRFELVNAAFRRISGGGRDDTGRTVREAFPELTGQGIVEALDRVYATGEPWAGTEVPLRYDRDGTGPQDTWYNVRYEPVRGLDGAAWGVLNFAVEVTHQVRARHEVERLLAESERARGEAEAARAEAQAANRTKGEFLAVMSHELRTPLNAIGGYAELIELGIHGPVTSEQRSALARIQASQRHLLGLIAGVLDYSRVEAGAVTYRLTDVPVGEAVAEAETLVAPQLRAKGLGYAWSGAPPGLRVRADREKLQQVLLNVLGNAVKFTDARPGVPGRIEVACAVADAGGGDGATGGYVDLRIRDTGAGIAQEKLAGVFEPFVQADQRLTRPQEGVGLGLAISRDLARGMGGDLTAESVPGVGSTFTLRLPRA